MRRNPPLKPSDDAPSSTSRPDSAAGSRASRNGAAFHTCAVKVSGEIHWLQGSCDRCTPASGKSQYDAKAGAFSRLHDPKSLAPVHRGPPEPSQAHAAAIAKLPCVFDLEIVRVFSRPNQVEARQVQVLVARPRAQAGGNRRQPQAPSVIKIRVLVVPQLRNLRQVHLSFARSLRRVTDSG